MRVVVSRRGAPIVWSIADSFVLSFGRDDGGGGATVVVVAYRKATIALADEVVYLDHGRVTGRGAHAELLETSEGYRDLVNAYERAEAEQEALDGGEEALA